MEYLIKSVAKEVIFRNFRGISHKFIFKRRQRSVLILHQREDCSTLDQDQILIIRLVACLLQSLSTPCFRENKTVSGALPRRSIQETGKRFCAIVDQ